MKFWRLLCHLIGPLLPLTKRFPFLSNFIHKPNSSSIDCKITKKSVNRQEVPPKIQQQTLFDCHSKNRKSSNNFGFSLVFLYVLLIICMQEYYDITLYSLKIPECAWQMNFSEIFCFCHHKGIFNSLYSFRYSVFLAM